MRVPIITPLLFIATLSFGQIREQDSDHADNLLANYRLHTDSTKDLKQGAKIHYLSDSLFKGMLLELANGDRKELDLRYRKKSFGYT